MSPATHLDRLAQAHVRVFQMECLLEWARQSGDGCWLDAAYRGMSQAMAEMSASAGSSTQGLNKETK